MGHGEATPCLSEPSRWGQARTAAETHGRREGVPYSQHFQVKGPAPPLSAREGSGCQTFTKSNTSSSHLKLQVDHLDVTAVFITC